MSEVREIKSAEELDDFLRSTNRAVVDFAKRNGCVPCKRLEPHYNAAAKSLDEVDFAVVHLDELEQADFYHLMDEFGLRSTPTVVYFDDTAVTVLEARTGPLLIKEINSLS